MPVADVEKFPGQLSKIRELFGFSVFRGSRNSKFWIPFLENIQLLSEKDPWTDTLQFSALQVSTSHIKGHNSPELNFCYALISLC